MRRLSASFAVGSPSRLLHGVRWFGGSAFSGDSLGGGGGGGMAEAMGNFGEAPESSIPKSPQQRINDVGMNTTGARARRSAPAPGSDVSPGAQAAAEALGYNVEGQTELKDDPSRNNTAPQLYNVPNQCNRTVGRDMNQLTLWQSLLAGRRVHLITGMDGIGKSTLAAEFADACRRNDRFSCIQWFDAQDSLPARLKEFSQLVKGRVEKDVLLIFDNVTDLAAVEKWIPTLKNIFVVITAPLLDPSTISKEFLQKHSVNLFVCSPLEWRSSSQLLGIESLEEDVVTRVCEYLGNAPLLVKVASALMGSGEVLTAEELLAALEAHHKDCDGTVSLSATLKMLMDMGKEKLRKEFGDDGIEALTSLACFQGKNIGANVVSAVHPQGDDLAAAAAAVGFLDPKWDSDGWIMHPTIAKVLRESSTADVEVVAEKAAGALLAAWPRRMRGDGTATAWNLVQHVSAVQKVVPKATRPDTLQLMQKVAAFLALTQGQELDLAASLLQTIFDASAGRPLSDMTDAEVAVARDLGLLQLRLKEPRAEVTLKTALERSNFLHGEGSVESASIVAALSGFLKPHDKAAMALLQDAASTLHQRAQGTGSDDTLTAEEQQHIRRNLFGVLLRIAQMTEQQGGTVSSSDWARLEALHKQLQPPAAKEAATE